MSGSAGGVMMYVDKDAMIVLAGNAVNMDPTGKEDWCIAWLEWFWEQEIEVAVWEAKQAGS